MALTGILIVQFGLAHWALLFRFNLDAGGWVFSFSKAGDLMRAEVCGDNLLHEFATR